MSILNGGDPESYRLSRFISPIRVVCGYAHLQGPDAILREHVHAGKKAGNDESKTKRH